VIARRIANVTDSVNVATDSKSPTFNFDKTFVCIANSEHEIDLLYLCVCVFKRK